MDSGDAILIELKTRTNTTDIYNVYVDCKHSNTLLTVDDSIKKRHPPSSPQSRSRDIVITGDFDRHHPMWEEDRNHHMFNKHNLNEAQIIIDIIAVHGLIQALPKNFPTLQSTSTKNWTRPDNTFISTSLMDRLIKCTTLPHLHPICTDHISTLTILDTSIHPPKAFTRWNYKKANWERFEETLKEKLSNIPFVSSYRTTEQAEIALRKLYDALSTTQEAHVPKTKSCAYMKRWWSSELTELRKSKQKLAWKSFNDRNSKSDPIHEEYRRARNEYREKIQEKKAKHQEEWIESTTNTSVWDVHGFINKPRSGGTSSRLPSLNRPNEEGPPTFCRTNEEKSDHLINHFYPPPRLDFSLEEPMVYPPSSYPFTTIKEKEIEVATDGLSPFKAPGPNGIPNLVFKKFKKELIPHLLPLFRATFDLDFFPKQWKTARTVVLKKPNKPDYFNRACIVQSPSWIQWVRFYPHAWPGDSLSKQKNTACCRRVISEENLEGLRQMPSCPPSLSSQTRGERVKWWPHSSWT